MKLSASAFDKLLGLTKNLGKVKKAHGSSDGVFS